MSEVLNEKFEEFGEQQVVMEAGAQTMPVLLPQ